MKGETSDEVGT